LRAQKFAEREAIDAWHLEIECNQIATHALQHAQRGSSFSGGYNTILCSLEDVAKSVAGRGVVVNYE
jgi:hypothetical protein